MALWVKGESGNPSGKPASAGKITAALREYADSIDPTTGKTQGALLGERLFELSRSKDLAIALAAGRYVTDRLDGKPIESVSLNADGKLVVEVVRIAKPSAEPGNDQPA